MPKGVEALKEWTGKSSATIIFDSVVDEFTDQGLFKKIKGKANIALVGFTADGDVFGSFYSLAVTEQDKWVYDRNMFVFSFESHGRCMPRVCPVWCVKCWLFLAWQRKDKLLLLRIVPRV